MQSDGSEEKITDVQDIRSDEENITIFIPIKTSDRNDLPEESVITVTSGYGTFEETVEKLKASDDDDEDALRRAAEACAFWKSMGIESLIYTSSYGGFTVVSGVFIRFLKTDPFLSVLLAGDLGVMSNDNARIFFGHLLGMPGETVPDVYKSRFNLFSKYGLLPISLLSSGLVTGSALALLGLPDVGTRQVVSAISSQLTGPFISLLRGGVRRCMGGKIVVKPDNPGVIKAFRNAYGTSPNKLDENRISVYGTMRNTITRMIGVSSTIAGSWFLGAYQLETYCDPEGRSILQNITATNGSYSGTDLRDNCVGGNFTFLFRELGVGFAYMIGLMVIQPITNSLFDMVFDYFYRPADGDDNDSEEVRIEEIDESSD